MAREGREEGLGMDEEEIEKGFAVLRLKFPSPLTTTGEDQRHQRNKLVSSLAVASLKHLLFAKGQVGKPIATLQLERQRERKLAQAEEGNRARGIALRSNTGRRKREKLLDNLEVVSRHVEDAIDRLAAGPGPSSRPDELALMIALGPSLVLPKELYYVDIKGGIHRQGGALPSNMDEKETSKGTAKTASVMERKLVRFLVESASEEEDEQPRPGSLAEAFEKSLAPTRAHLLLLAPPAFSCPGWIPKRHLKFDTTATGTQFGPARQPTASLQNGKARVEEKSPAYKEASDIGAASTSAVHSKPYASESRKSEAGFAISHAQIENIESDAVASRQHSEASTPSHSIKTSSTIDGNDEPSNSPTRRKRDESEAARSDIRQIQDITELSEALSPLKRKLKTETPLARRKVFNGGSSNSSSSGGSSNARRLLFSEPAARTSRGTRLGDEGIGASSSPFGSMPVSSGKPPRRPFFPGPIKLSDFDINHREALEKEDGEVAPSPLAPTMMNATDVEKVEANGQNSIDEKRQIRARQRAEQLKSKQQKETSLSSPASSFAAKRGSKQPITAAFEIHCSKGDDSNGSAGYRDKEEPLDDDRVWFLSRSNLSGFQ